MFNLKSTTKSPLDEVIEDAIRELKGHTADTEEYSKIVEQIEKLTEIRESTKNRIDRNSLLLVAGNLAGILMIINHEQVHVITSKALPFVGKFK